MTSEAPSQRRVALVTGAASGIGRATVQRFLRENFCVAALDKDPLSMSGPDILPLCCDVTDSVALEDCVRAVTAQWSRIDILVNGAGMSTYERLSESSRENWRKTFEVNLESMYVLARLVVPEMIRLGGGRIVNISSTQSLAAEATVGAYAASKGAINAWSRALAVDLAPHGILVNVVAPGCIHTGMSVVEGVDETTTEDFQEWYVRRRKIPLGRPGRAEEVADAIAFLSSENCTYMTGSLLVVDGGLTATF